MNVFNIGPMELLLILVVVLIVFGPNKIPEIGASLGRSLRKFREASKELTEELDLEELNPSTLSDALVAMADTEEEKPTATPAAETPPASPPPAEAGQVPTTPVTPGAEGTLDQGSASQPEPTPEAGPQLQAGDLPAADAQGIAQSELPPSEVFSTDYESPEDHA